MLKHERSIHPTWRSIFNRLNNQQKMILEVAKLNLKSGKAKEFEYDFK